MTYAQSKDPDTYTFGVVPQFDSRETLRVWQPLLAELKKRTGLNFRLIGSININKFESQLLANEFDFAYMNPYHALMTSQLNGYVPLVRDIEAHLYGVLVVRKNSAIQDIKNLEGKLVAFPSPNALGASLILRANLKNTYNISIKPKYVQNHSSVYLNVALGEAEAGGGVQKTLLQQPEVLKDKLRVIYKSQAIMPHPIATHSRVPPEVQNKVRQALLSLSKTDKGIKILREIPIKTLGITSIDEYQTLKELGLESFYEHN